MDSLQSWNKKTNGHMHQHIEKLRKELEQTWRRRDDSSLKKARNFERELDGLLAKEEI
jgi:hypothetical protein